MAQAQDKGEEAVKPAPRNLIGGDRVEKKRIAFFDNCKFFLILLVVVGHFIDQNTASSPIYRGLFLCIYTFHMPAFFFMSGLFDQRKTPFSKRLNKAIYYFSLYIVLKIVITLVQAAFTGRFKFTLLTEVGIPWFCLVLGVFTLITGLLDKANVNLTTAFVISVLLACFAGFDQSLGDYLALSRTIIYYPVYLFGVIVEKEKLLGLLSKKWLRVCGLAVLIAYLVICLMMTEQLYPLRQVFTGRNPFAASYRSYGPLVRLGCYGLTGVIGLAFMLIVPQRSLGKITDFGQRTMQVYFWHRPVLYVMVYLHLNDSVLSLGAAGKAIWIILAVILTLILSLSVFSFPTAHLQRWLQNRRRD